MHKSNAPLLLACFISGAASLVYEILWTRAFSLLLGSTTQATSLVFAAFLTGLALGAWVFGRQTRYLKNPVHTYIFLEIGIAVTATATGLLLHRYADTLGAIVGNGSTQFISAFIIAAVLILPPTLLMGGTLPVMLTIAQRSDSRQTIVGQYYGWNTFGAAVGTLVCGFFSIRLLGVTQSYLLGAALNVGAAISCALCYRSLVTVPGHAKPQTNSGTRTAAASAYLPERYLLSIALSSGLIVLSLEVVWARFAGFFLGNRTYAFTTLMFAVLSLLAIGSWLSSRLSRSTSGTPDPFRPFILLLALAALCISLSSGAGWWLIDNQAWIEARLPALSQLILVYRFAEAWLLLSGPLICLGALFPLAIASAPSLTENIGLTTARYYGINALGVILGSLGTGFVAVSVLGSFGVLRLLIALLLLLAMYSLYLGSRPVSRLSLSLVVLAICTTAILPTRFPSGLSQGERLIQENEDQYGVFRIVELENHRLRVTNNRSELIFHLGPFITDYVQQMQGHLGVHFNPQARNALVIGNGYGITAGALGAYDQLKQIDAVELLPNMVAAAATFEPHNLGYYKNPKISTYTDDGRHFLSRQNNSYDIISVNVSDPHLPGGSTLFHSEFYQLAKRHLNPGGVLIQHVFGSERGIIAHTLATAFPFTLFSPSYNNGYNIVASMTSLDNRAMERMKLPGAALRQLRRSASGQAVPRIQFLAYDELADDMHSNILATDDFPAVEFSWNRGIDKLFINE